MVLKKQINTLSATLVAFSLLLPTAIFPPTAEAAKSILFPVNGPARFVNDYYTPRPGGIHQATDVMASKGQSLVAVADGIVTYVNYPQPSWGYAIELRDAEGYTYTYLHMNDDNPGTNDGRGGAMHAYAPDMKSGNRVVRGQLIGWVGDSGNSNGVPHLHFEMTNPDGSPSNPFQSLVEAQRISSPLPYPRLPNEILPYGADFLGGLNIAMGEFDADQGSELITGAGYGGGPHIKLLDHTSALLSEFFAYPQDFKGGVDVAAGDVDGDGTNEIITGAGQGGSSHVRIFNKNGAAVGGFFAYEPSFWGSVRVAAGDVDGDGKDEIITGAGPGGGPRVRVFRANGSELTGFFAYDPAFRGGVDVASADIEGSSRDEIITGAGPSGGPQVRVFQFDGGVLTGLREFYAYALDFRGGVRVSAGNSRTNTPKSEILTAPDSKGGPHIKMFDPNGTMISHKMFIEEWWLGYSDIAAGYDTSRAATGTNRRASLRAAFY